jgi:hypothetical protein
MYIVILGILYHDVSIAMGIPNHSVDFKGAVKVLHFGFLFNDECFYNYEFTWCKNSSYFLLKIKLYLYYL